ncbi:hypothetical protein [Pseudomonas sp. OA65]|uniref:hypothetical protein n=1 Tax=Pseudomonas sp. OA65 TaxID=2818431 RepID=UPI001A9EEF2F|nr:hypothetical protein [Pseudomonas sp. OA65]MBO1537572.1 hypothetical protein [Pseudomonas sp. OA65]
MKFQVSLFGDFSLLTPTEDNIKKCIEGFFSSGLLPGNLQELNLQTNKMEPRLALQSMRNGLSVNILLNRIDFVATPLPGSPSASLTMEVFFDEVRKIAEQLRKTFEITYKRMGVVCDKFLQEMSEDQLQQLRKVFIKEAFDVIPDASIVEWSVRNVALIAFADPVNQEVNAIYNLSKVHVQLNDASGNREFDTLLLNIDINIPTEKRIANLSAEFIDTFLTKTLEIQGNINKGIGEVIQRANN